ncbi:MAG: hypothetical protein D6683_17410 [Actinomyces sp.]|nr:MAG: hypothetical protein D6683_17410 [Actinomyces sp.]
MTDTPTDLTDEPSEGGDPAGLRKRAEEALKAAREAEARAAEAERRAAFAEAGIPTEGVGALFRKAYDGEASVEAIREAAAAYGILGAGTTPGTSDAVPESEAQALATAATGVASTTEPASPSGAASINDEIVRLYQAGDPDALLGFLEDQGLLADPDSREFEPRLINSTPRMPGVSGDNPTGVNPQVI